MSGGSFEYLHLASPGELLGKADLLVRMRDALAGHPDAARETEAIARALSDFEREMQARIDRIAPVWKAVEWTASGDAGPDHVEKVAAAWRTRNPPLPAEASEGACDPRALIDWSSLYASEGYIWQSTATVMDLIALARLRRPTQADADRIKKGETLRRIAATEAGGS